MLLNIRDIKIDYYMHFPILIYVNDVYSSRVTPLKELKGFRRVTLKPGESKRVTFTILADDLGVFQDDRRFVTEPGIFQVMISELEGSFEVTG